MKKLVFLFVLALCFSTALISCEAEELNNETTEISSENVIYACPAPDTNCNGTPDHCDDENGNPIPGCV